MGSAGLALHDASEDSGQAKPSRFAARNEWGFLGSMGLLHLCSGCPHSIAALPAIC